MQRDVNLLTIPKRYQEICFRLIGTVPNIFDSVSCDWEKIVLRRDPLTGRFVRPSEEGTACFVFVRDERFVLTCVSEAGLAYSKPHMWSDIVRTADAALSKLDNLT